MPIRVLIIDHHPDFRAIARDLLEDARFARFCLRLSTSTHRVGSSSVATATCDHNRMLEDTMRLGSVSDNDLRKSASQSGTIPV